MTCTSSVAKSTIVATEPRADRARNPGLDPLLVDMQRRVRTAALPPTQIGRAHV